MTIKILLTFFLFLPIGLPAKIIINGKEINTNCYFENNNNQSLLVVAGNCDKTVNQELIEQQFKEICIKLKRKGNYISKLHQFVEFKFHDQLIESCKNK